MDGRPPRRPLPLDRGDGRGAARPRSSTRTPGTELGAAAVEKFGPRLPFLLKLLAAGAPLSLQVHPDLAQAKQGYADEERRGVPVDAPHRNYKDANHKPELICALTQFDGLCGFRARRQTAALLAGLDVDSLKPYVDILRARPEEAALREVLTAVLTADPEAMAGTVTEAGDRRPAASAGGRTPRTPAIAHHYPGDPGVIAAMLLNHVRLQPGEALFLGAGIPHAYLNGLGVEIMANSDNVLRCGLTPKHVDVPELLRVVRFEASDPGVLRPEAVARRRGALRAPPSTSSGSPATSLAAERRRPARPSPAATAADPALHRGPPAQPGNRPTDPRTGPVGLRPRGREGRHCPGAGTIFRATVGLTRRRDRTA